jgi:hypothetical protein
VGISKLRSLNINDSSIPAARRDLEKPIIDFDEFISRNAVRIPGRLFKVFLILL